MDTPPVLTDAQGVTIDYFESIPTNPGIGLIRLPRCANCFDEVHDYSFSKAYCTPSTLSNKSKPMQWRRMDGPQLEAWTAAEREEQERREREA